MRRQGLEEPRGYPEAGAGPASALGPILSAKLISSVPVFVLVPAPSPPPSSWDPEPLSILWCKPGFTEVALPHFSSIQTAAKYSLNLLATGSAVLPAAVLLGMGIIAVSRITLYALNEVRADPGLVPGEVWAGWGWMGIGSMHE